jgi:hypothetical protein
MRILLKPTSVEQPSETLVSGLVPCHGSRHRHLEWARLDQNWVFPPQCGSPWPPSTEVIPSPPHHAHGLNLLRLEPQARQFASSSSSSSSLSIHSTYLLPHVVNVMASSQPSAPRSKPARKRSVQACLTCRSRKVRCDVSLHGQPCTNCSLDEKQCLVPQGTTVW